MNLVLLLERTKLSAQSLRLVHGLLYYMDLATDGDLIQIAKVFLNGPGRIRCAQLRLEVATPGTKDNDWIRDAIPELLDQKLFRTLSISTNGRFVEFRPGTALNVASSMKRFAPMRTKHIKACRTVRDFLFLTSAALHGGGPYPTWYLPRIGTAPLAEPWEDCRDSWLDAAVKVSTLLAQDYLIGPSAGVMSQTIDSVKIKGCHAETKWEPGKLYKMPIGSRPFPIVSGMRYRPLTKTEMEARVNWCVIRAEDKPRKGAQLPGDDAPAALIRAAQDGVASAAVAPPPLVEEEFPF